MGYLRTSLSAIAIASLAACGSDGHSNIDAPVVPDAPRDAKPIDAPPDAIQYNFTCAANPFPTTAPATITLAGVVATLSQGGGAPVAAATVQIFKRGTVAPIVTKTSDAQGAWASGDLTTGGVPIDGFIHVSHADDATTTPPTTYRSSYIFPPQALSASIPALPTPIVTGATFALLANLASPPQDNTLNGVVLVNLLDCANTPVGDATLTAKQGGNAVGQVVDVGQLIAQARGLYVVFNVPAGDTVVGASINSMTFHEHTVTAFKASPGAATPDKNGTVTTTLVRPGPL